MKKILLSLVFLIVLGGCKSKQETIAEKLVNEKAHYTAEEVIGILIEEGFEERDFDEWAFIIKEDAAFRIYMDKKEVIISNTSRQYVWELIRSRHEFIFLLRQSDQACAYDFKRNEYGYGKGDVDLVSMGIVNLQYGDFDSNDFCPSIVNQALEEFVSDLNEMGLNLGDIQVFLKDKMKGISS